MERIIIIGCGGSGKSTLARKLGSATGLPVVHLDQPSWREGWTSIPRDEFDRLLMDELEKPRWIMDGNFNRTIPLRLTYCDTVIFLDFPRLLCVLGVLRRVLGNYGRTRPDMAPGCPEKFDPAFLKWVWNWRKNHRSRVLALLEESPAQKIILKNRRQVNRFLDNIRNEVLS